MKQTIQTLERIEELLKQVEVRIGGHGMEMDVKTSAFCRISVGSIIASIERAEEQNPYEGEEGQAERTDWDYDDQPDYDCESVTKLMCTNLYLANKVADLNVKNAHNAKHQAQLWQQIGGLNKELLICDGVIRNLMLMSEREAG